MKAALFSIFVSALLLSTTAHAQTAGEQSFLCNRAAAYQPAVGTEYQPGVNVYGKPVPSADGTTQIITLPPTVQIPVTIDIAQWLQLNLPPGIRMESVMGFAEVAQDGKVSWNGQDITQNVVAACSSVKIDGK